MCVQMPILLDIQHFFSRMSKWEDLLERDVVGHFNILAWRFPMDEGDLQATVHRVAKTEETDLVLLELGK